MSKKTKKAQVVIAAIDSVSQSFSLLLMQTNQKRGEFWQNVTGKVEDEETFEEGGLREAMEETGLTLESIIDLLELGLTFDFVDQRSRHVHEKTFLLILDKKWDVKIDPKEHQGYRWISLDELSEDSVKYPSNFETLLKAKHLLKHWGL